MRFRHLIILLLITFVAAILAVRVLGGRQPSVVDMLFTNPDGSPCERPCLFGIRPGVTKIDEALSILNTHPLIEPQADKNGPAAVVAGQAVSIGRGLFAGKFLDIVLYANDNDTVEEITLVIVSEEAIYGDKPPP